MSRRRAKLVRSGRRIFAALVLCIGVASPAAAQQTCDKREKLVMQLTHTHGELPQVMGLNGAGIMELWAGQNGSWTITNTRPDGIMCVIGAGQSFVRLDPKFGEPA